VFDDYSRERGDSVKARKRKPLRSATSRTLYQRLGRVPRRRREQRVGFAWYKAEQWSRLRELAADVANLEARYEAWLAAAEKTEADLALRGIMVERVPVDVEAVADWCTRQGRPFNSEARADFVAEAMWKRSGKS
jgi:hypothetical protein